MATDGARTFVLVPGGWHGGWAYDLVTARLRERGHAVVPITLAGLEDEPATHDGPTPNLDTHIHQVIEIVRGIGSGRVVLCGHSYGGLVITGAADAIPERIERLVYIDAYVPDDGDTCWALTSQRYRDRFASGAEPDGRLVAVPPGLDPRARPHPLPSFMQAIRLTGAARRPARTFVGGGSWRGTPFLELVERLRVDPAWDVRELPVGHDIMNRAPDNLVAILDPD